ncbi:MBL fold metallo-hydrolase [Granulosicoccus sp. 3-233]|uniref:MBL fold metallo-hydrolase n=1 Tax=Granulosicoccus sp. 3-233 TaxID=3417969 RepID=UPI003D3260B2
MSASPIVRNGLEFPFDSSPEPHESRLICESIRWQRLPLPFALDHVNCWLLGEPGKQVLVDTGVDLPGSREQWQLHFGQAGDSIASPPESLLVTHFHPDHSGLAGWFAKAGSRLYGSAVEVGLSRMLCNIDDEHYGDFYADWYASNGLDAARVEAVRRNANTYRRIVHQPPEDAAWTFLRDSQSVELGGEHYAVMIGRGHAPDMLMLYRERDHVLIAADQILPSISPNVSVMPRLQDPNPLESFLQTLDSLKRLPADTLVLPSHGLPFRGLHARIAALEAHHQARLDEVWQACAEPASAHDLFGVLFRRELDAQQMSFALGESLAHLHHLENAGRLQRSLDDGVVRFRQSG